MRKICFFLVYLFIAQTAGGEVDFDIDSKIFIPPVYYIGDEVELRIKIKIFDEPVAIVIPGTLPVEQWIEINKVSFINFPADTVTLNIFFKVFKPGKHILPTLNLGDIVLDGIEISVQSITEEMVTKKINPRRSQLELPGTRVKITILILSIILIPAGLFFLINYLLYLYKKIRLSKEKEAPRNYANKALQQLAKRMDAIDSKEFYTCLAGIIRNYIERRFLIPALTLTTRELAGFFNNSIHETVLQSKLIRFSGLLAYADLIKFSTKESSNAEKSATVDAVVKIVALIEEVPEVAKS